MERFILSFFGEDTPELYESYFYHPFAGEERLCVRGRESGAYVGFNTFQWTKAVQALCVLTIYTVLEYLKGRDKAARPALMGSKNSPAASLDYALDKRCSWLCDMFGTDAHGRIVAKRVLLRSNPGQRRKGPVAVSINPNFISPASISIRIANREIRGAAELKNILEKLERQHKPSIHSLGSVSPLGLEPVCNPS